MISKNNIFTLGAASILIVAVLAANNPGLMQRNLNANILGLIARSGDMMQRNPLLIALCMDSYSATSNDIIADFTKQSDICFQDADSKRNEVDLEGLIARTDLANEVKRSCVAVDECQNATTVGDQYGCLTTKTSDGAGVMRGVSNNGTLQQADYMENMRIIENKESLCINDTRIALQVNNTNNYFRFLDCCNGRIQPSPVPTPTSAPNETTVSP